MVDTGSVGIGVCKRRDETRGATSTSAGVLVTRFERGIDRPTAESSSSSGAAAEVGASIGFNGAEETAAAAAAEARVVRVGLCGDDGAGADAAAETGVAGLVTTAGTAAGIRGAFTLRFSFTLTSSSIGE